MKKPMEQLAILQYLANSGEVEIKLETGDGKELSLDLRVIAQWIAYLQQRVWEDGDE